MIFYTRHLGDYAKDTTHLSMLEHGAYTLLMDWYYSNENPIPADKIYRIAKAATDAEKHAVDCVIADFFTNVNGIVYQKRIAEEIEKYREKSQKAADAAKARWSRCERNADGMRTHSERNADGMLSIIHNPLTINQDNILSRLSDTPEVDSEKPVDRIPYSAVFDLFEEICVSLPKTRIRDDARKSLIKKVWKMDEQHQDIEFFNWLFNKVERSDFLSGRSGKYKNCGFDWILKPANFKKIVEGNYDNR